MSTFKYLCRVAVVTALLGSSSTEASFELGLGDDSDLTHFVTRPDIKAPILNVTKYHPDHVAPGYFFTTPYIRLYQESWATSYYQPCQSGSHIYDNNGDLVWSGACQFANRNQANFRPVFFNGAWHLSGIESGLREETQGGYGSGNSSGHGFILDSSYAVQATVRMPKNIESFSIQEFWLVDDGKSALSITSKPEYVDVSMLENVGREAGWVDSMGFVETDVTTGKILFQWWALDHVDLTESTWTPRGLQGPLPDGWGFFFLDSVDKTPAGDYLISSRHTDTIYSISHKDGSIQWRLGGKKSDFTLKDFSFSRQHDARFLDPSVVPFKTKKGVDYISLFNNAADEYDRAPATASVLIVALDHKHKTAQVVREVTRPDGRSTIVSGNSHYLPNGNLLASWMTNSYVTEHDADDRLVMEARFLSNRFTTYRAFKSDFQAAAPADPPALSCTAYGTAEAKATTVCWASWNGATEVRRWRFRAAASPSRDDSADVLGTVSRTGFETRLQSKGYTPFVLVEALGADGQVLGRSEQVEVSVAQPWRES